MKINKSKSNYEKTYKRIRNYDIIQNGLTLIVYSLTFFMFILMIYLSKYPIESTFAFFLNFMLFYGFFVLAYSLFSVFRIHTYRRSDECFYSLYEAYNCLEKFLSNNDRKEYLKAINKLSDSANNYGSLFGLFFPEEHPVYRLSKYFALRIKNLIYWISIYKSQRNLTVVKNKIKDLAFAVYENNFYDVFRILNNLPSLGYPFPLPNNPQGLYNKDLEKIIFASTKRRRFLDFSKNILMFFETYWKSITIIVLFLLFVYFIFTGNSTVLNLMRGIIERT